ncbi:LamG domain-containing protein [Haliangium sp.]|uniref:LamG domain-containing protein n=1 Tax=Haliangium sp. TaxID=2663208 RepID=UPI003D1031CA
MMKYMCRHASGFMVVTLALASSTACEHSLFDAHVGLTCPEPCLGDAVRDFADTPGGANQRWNYYVDTGTESGAQLLPLTWGTWEGTQAWLAGAAPPAIIDCRGNAGRSVCSGASGTVLLVPATGQYPALSFRAPFDATFSIQGEYQSASGAPGGVPQTFLISRNARHDVVHKESFVTSGDTRAFSTTMSALAGDEILLTLLPPDDGRLAPIGFRLFVSSVGGDQAFPGECLFALTFDGESPFPDHCGGAQVAVLEDQTKGPGVSVSDSAPASRFGTARRLGEGNYMVSNGGALDYADDFTVQFWARLDEPQPSFDAAAFVDWNSRARGGISSFFGEEAGIDVCVMWDEGGDAEVADCIVNAARPLDGGWHFYRIVRSTEDEIVRLCVDGRVRGSVGVPGDVSITGDQPPHLGRNVDYNPAYFGGSFDDVRVIKRALPCPTAL